MHNSRCRRTDLHEIQYTDSLNPRVGNRIALSRKIAQMRSGCGNSHTQELTFLRLFLQKNTYVKSMRVAGCGVCIKICNS